MVTIAQCVFRGVGGGLVKLNPIFQRKIRNTTELSGVSCDYCSPSDESLCGYLDIIWPDGSALPFEIAAKISGGNGVLGGERDDMKRGKKHCQFEPVIFHPLAFTDSIFKLEHGDGRNEQFGRVV